MKWTKLRYSQKKYFTILFRKCKYNFRRNTLFLLIKFVLTDTIINIWKGKNKWGWICRACLSSQHSHKAERERYLSQWGAGEPCLCEILSQNWKTQDHKIKMLTNLMLCRKNFKHVKYLLVKFPSHDFRRMLRSKSIVTNFYETQ